MDAYLDPRSASFRAILDHSARTPRDQGTPVIGQSFDLLISSLIVGCSEIIAQPHGERHGSVPAGLPWPIGSDPPCTIPVNRFAAHLSIRGRL